MLNLKYLFSLVIVCVCTAALSAQANQTIYQTFTPATAITVLELDVEQNVDNIEIRKTKGTRVVVETTVKLSTPNANLLAYLAESGRYNLVEFLNTGEERYSLSSKKNLNVLLVKGEECHEEIRYVIQVPESIPHVVIKNGDELLNANVN